MDDTAQIKTLRRPDLNCKSPLLFTIPLNIYSDEIVKERDKEAFLKIRDLAEKFEQLRQKFHSYAEKHLVRIETTKYLVWRTMAVKENIRKRKNNSEGFNAID